MKLVTLKNYTTPGYLKSQNGVCDVVIDYHDGRAVVTITELPENEGISVTNSIERIAQNLKIQYVLRDDTIWIEHYPERLNERMSDSTHKFVEQEESFDFVTFETTRPFGGVKWKRITKEVWHMITGNVIK